MGTRWVYNITQQVKYRSLSESQDTELWLGESADEAMRCSQNGMRWMISMVSRDNDGFKWYFIQFTIAGFWVYNSFYTVSQGAYLQVARRARFTMLFTIFSQILCSLFSFFSFIYNIHRGIWVAGSPLFWRYKFFCILPKSICQQWEFLYYLLLKQ